MEVLKSFTWRTFLLLGMILGTIFQLYGNIPASQAAPSSKQQGQPIHQEYLVGIGDVLEISVWHEPDISTDVFVRLDGRISLPLVGDVLAEGLSPEALAQTISQKISEFISDPSVTVTLKASRSRMYYALGQIAKPGEYSLSTPVSIIQAIARAGGFAEWAKKDKVIVVRRHAGKEKIISFDYDKFVGGKNLGQNLSLQPGDTLIVP
ncbi:MAG: polysaccharide biosynthesis/export family protein [Thermodesulfobacteriota bacterium]